MTLFQSKRVPLKRNWCSSKGTLKREQVGSSQLPPNSIVTCINKFSFPNIHLDNRQHIHRHHISSIAALSLKKEPFLLLFIILGKNLEWLLSCYFTKIRPLKISEIEKINRQTTDKNMLILTKQPTQNVRTLS